MERGNSAFSDALKQLPIYTVGGWVWIYNTAATIRHGTKFGTGAKVLKAKLSLDWTGPFKVLAVGPSPSDFTPDGCPLAGKLFYLGLLNDMPGHGAHCRISVARCKPCTNAHDTTDLPPYLPAGFTQDVLNNYSTKFPAVSTSQQTTSPCPSSTWRPTRLPATGPHEAGGSHRCSLRNTLEKASCGHPGNANRTSFTLANTPNTGPARPCNLDRRTGCRHACVGATQRGLARDKGARFLPPGYS